ncbi:MAG: hypothetical protein ACYSWU_24185, partial [Planctomycetota bacterium]
PEAPDWRKGKLRRDSNGKFVIEPSGPAGGRNGVRQTTNKAPPAELALPRLLEQVKRVAPGQWSLVPGTALRPVLTTESEAESLGIRGGSGPKSVLIAWNGAAYDSARHVMYFFGGGHADYGGNEVYSLDLKTLSVARRMAPETLAEPNPKDSTCPLPASGPAAPHTYDGFIADPATGKVYQFSNMGFCPTGDFWGNWIAEFDPVSNTWTRLSAFDDAVHSPFSVYDPANNRIVLLSSGPTSRYHFDLASKTNNLDGPLSGSRGAWLSFGSAIPDNQNPGYMLMAAWGDGANNLYRIAYAGDPTPVLVTALPAGITSESGFAQRANGDLYAWSGNSVLWRYSGGAWTQEALAVGPSGDYRVYSKWIYISQLDAFAGMSNLDEGLWLYCPADGCNPVQEPGDGGEAGPGGNFAELCADPDTILCRDFSVQPPSAWQGDEGVFVNSDETNPALPTVENGQLKFTVKSQSGPGAGGQYFVRFDPVMPGGTIYARWEQVFDAAFVNDMKAAGGDGFKLGMIGDADQTSCASNHIVLQNVGWDGYVRGYHACGIYEGFEVQVPTEPRGSDWDRQPGGDNLCLWKGSLQADGTYLDEPGNCYTFKADEQMVFELAVDLNPDPTQPSRIRVWVTRESRGRELVIDYSRVLVDGALGYGALWLMPYVTRKDPSVAHPEAYTWVDNLLVSRSIPF